MKFKLLFLIFIFSSTFFFAQNEKNLTILDGTVTGGNYTEISLLDAMSGDEIVKTNISDNKFHFDFEIESENIYALFINKQEYIIVDLKPGETVTINYDIDNRMNISAIGSPGTAFYLTTVAKIKTMPEDKIEPFIDSIVNKNPGKLATALFAMYLDYNEYAATHKKLIESLDDFSDNKLVQDYKKNYEASQKMALGSVPPEIALEDVDGNVIKLSSLKGQYVLVDFWAAWCRPCRGESPNLVKAFKKYQDKGFTIYSVSLDNKKEDWLNAIAKDNLSAWTHVSDLKGWSCSAAADYGVRSIPANFLLDKEGKIIAKNLRGDKLEQKLSEIFDN